MRPARCLIAVAVLLGSQPCVQAAEPVIPDSLYRAGTPTVLQPEEDSPLRHREEIVKSFARAYQKQGRPRIALFWNRPYDDQASAWTEGLRVTESERTRLNGTLSREHGEGAGATAPVAGSLSADLSRDRSVQAEWREPQRQRWNLDEALTLELEAGFTAALNEATVMVVDRAAIMRLQDRAHPAADADARRLETDALLGRADLLIEVLMAPYRPAPLGASFRVSVQEVRTGQIVANRTGDGHAAALTAGGRWQVGDDGFVAASGQRLESARLIGQELALTTMAALTERWR